MSRKKRKIEFRYYQIPAESPILALLGEKWVHTYGGNVGDLHFHNHLEIGFCYYGNGDMVLGEEAVRFGGREFTVIPRNYLHTTDSDPGTVSSWEYLFINVEDFVRGFPDNPMRMERMIRRINSRALFLKEEEQPQLAKKILKILDIMRNAEEFYLEEAKGILMAAMAEIARINSDFDEEKLNEQSGKITNMISRSLDYTADHFMEDIKIEDFARYCHISETHFRRIFSAHMHMSPLEYVNYVRIRTACELLKKTDDSVADIAYKCGFKTNSTFNRNFKKVMGVTPVEWRKRPENYEQQLLKYDIHQEEGW